MTFLGM